MKEVLETLFACDMETSCFGNRGLEFQVRQAYVCAMCFDPLRLLQVCASE